MGRIRTIKPDKFNWKERYFKKQRISYETRIGLAKKYGAKPGETTNANCFYCGCEGKICWTWLNRKGQPSNWVYFTLEIDHYNPEFKGNSSSLDNLVLACRKCNRSKGHKDPEKFIEELRKCRT